MWDFLNSLLRATFEFIHWLVFVKLTNWEKNRLRQMGFESQEELDELMRQRYKDEIGDFSPEQEEERLRRFPGIRSALRHRALLITTRESSEQMPSDLDDDLEVF